MEPSSLSPGEAVHGLAGRDCVAVDLLQHRFGVRLLERAFDRIIPGEVAGSAGPSDPWNRAYSLFRRCPSLKMKSQFAAAIAGRLDGFVMPLQQPLGIGEAAVLFGMGGGGERRRPRLRCLRAHLAAFDFGASRQNSAVSVSWKSRTTSHSSLRMAFALEARRSSIRPRDFRP